jgi:hypothetical protein
MAFTKYLLPALAAAATALGTPDPSLLESFDPTRQANSGHCYALEFLEGYES